MEQGAGEYAHLPLSILTSGHPLRISPRDAFLCICVSVSAFLCLSLPVWPCLSPFLCLLCLSLKGSHRLRLRHPTSSRTDLLISPFALSAATPKPLAIGRRPQHPSSSSWSAEMMSSPLSPFVVSVDGVFSLSQLCPTVPNSPGMLSSPSTDDLCFRQAIKIPFSMAGTGVTSNKFQFSPLS